MLIYMITDEIDHYQNEFQLTTKGNIYNLSEAAAWIADTRDDPD